MTKSAFRDYCRSSINTSRSSPYVNQDWLSLLELDNEHIHMDILAEFTDLERLTIAYSNLKTLGQEISSLQKLSTLIIKDCLFEEVPEVVFDLKKMSTLGIQYTKLKTLPIALFEELPLLTKLYLDYNQITSVPNLSKKNESLEVITLRYNHIGQLPDGFLYNLPNLACLELEGNPLKE